MNSTAAGVGGGVRRLGAGVEPPAAGSAVPPDCSASTSHQRWRWRALRPAWPPAPSRRLPAGRRGSGGPARAAAAKTPACRSGLQARAAGVAIRGHQSCRPAGQPSCRAQPAQAAHLRGIAEARPVQTTMACSCPSSPGAAPPARGCAPCRRRRRVRPPPTALQLRHHSRGAAARHRRCRQRRQPLQPC